MRNHKILFLVLVLLVFALEVQAQCPMCRIAAESNLENGGSQGKGLNLGILYILATPYLLVGTIGFIWWRNRRRQVEE
ncbi:MAG: hypothetical protein RL181_2326 [Bacteroidota bacterium]|jgi:hypothetical protein